MLLKILIPATSFFQKAWMSIKSNEKTVGKRVQNAAVPVSAVIKFKKLALELSLNPKKL